MDINVHEPIRNTQKTVRRARKQAGRRAQNTSRRATDTFESARGIDLHEPAHVAKEVAKRTAKRAAKRAGRETAAASGRVARQKAKPAGRRIARASFAALLAGILIAAILFAVKRMRTAPDSASPLGLSTFARADDTSESIDDASGAQSGSNGQGAAAGTQHTPHESQTENG